MLRVEEISSKKDMKKFTNFVNKLYKGCSQYVPPFYGDSVGLASPKTNPSLKDVEAKFWLCYDENVVVGRICAILQKEYNEKANKKYVRFTRFDVIDDINVTKLLFNEVFKFARERGMDTIHGPLGFNDFDEEGLVVDGFHAMTTFSNAYHFDYYMKHLEALGFVKEADWIEYKIFIPKEVDPKYTRMAELIKKRYKLRDVSDGKSTKYIIKHYGDKIFELLNKCYADLHGFVQLSDEVRDNLIKSFALSVNPRYISLICDENDNLVAFGLALSSLAKSLKKCDGKLFPFGFIHVLKDIKHPEFIELAFIAIDDDYKNKGLIALIFDKMIRHAIEDGIPYAESNAELEENKRVQAVFKNFELEHHRRRRCYVLEMDK